MKKILLILFLFSASLSMAQDPKDRQERIIALKIAFITEKLNLTTEEAQKFWPIYNSYESELRQVIKENRGGEDILDGEERVLDLRKKFRPEFAKILGQQRVNRLFKAEGEFRNILIKRLRNQQKPQNQQRPNLRRSN